MLLCVLCVYSILFQISLSAINVKKDERRDTKPTIIVKMGLSSGVEVFNITGATFSKNMSIPV